MFKYRSILNIFFWDNRAAKDLLWPGNTNSTCFGFPVAILTTLSCCRVRACFPHRCEVFSSKHKSHVIQRTVLSCSPRQWNFRWKTFIWSLASSSSASSSSSSSSSSSFYKHCRTLVLWKKVGTYYVFCISMGSSLVWREARSIFNFRGHIDKWVSQILTIKNGGKMGNLSLK